MAIKKSSAPTIIDVAELAGVSRATASRAMGGYGRIAEQTVAQVRKVGSEATNRVICLDGVAADSTFARACSTW